MNQTDDILEKITAFADKAHGSQQRKYTPERYIAHPVRVMKICREYTQELPVLAAALLHDVLEDTSTGKQEIKDFLVTVMDIQQADYTVKLVEELSDVYVKAAYPQWNRKKRKAKEAERIAKTGAGSQTVKYADIIDNCSEIVKYDPDFADVFLRECKNILKRIPKGNPELYERAVQTVNDNISKLHKNEV